ncbi:unannotated protein [freshwater metagenome]|uniref:Unannotated protein n=1 Tax=freshwater metagenome TaxID=449393 RepID=A0A6J6PNQ2_9ZZZZ
MGDPAAPSVQLHIVSDATGETAARIVMATEVQFPDGNFQVIRHPRVETVSHLRLVVERMRGQPAVAIYTLVEPQLRTEMRRLCRAAHIHYCDVLAQPLRAIAKVSGQAARMTPRARLPLDDRYFRRISAIEFAVKTDDGVGSALGKADVVLVGVSRTSKTPLSMYLGYLGLKTTNVPLVNGIDPPEELFKADPKKIVGLTIDANRLAEIRSERIQMMGGNKSYADLNGIYEELDFANAVFRRLRCPVIDVSELSIEEIALRIVRSVGATTVTSFEPPTRDQDNV